jgi:uncharacterized protein
VIVETLKCFYNQGNRQSLYFWRDRTGHEIDLLIDTGGKLHPVEIKASQTLQPQFFKNMDFFNQISGNDPAEAMVIYAGDLNQKRTQGQICSWDAFQQSLSFPAD